MDGANYHCYVLGYCIRNSTIFCHLPFSVVYTITVFYYVSIALCLLIFP